MIEKDLYKHWEAYNLDTGLLINFGAKSLEYKRVINIPRK